MKPWLPLLFLCVTFPLSAAEAVTSREAILEKTIVPEISFKEVPLNAVLDYFAKPGKDRPALNFIRIYPKETGEKIINLQLTEVPLKVALDYIGQIAGVQFIPDRYAIRVEAPANKTP